MTTDDREVLSLFSGMGGLDFGAHLAGFRIAGAVDSDESALDVLRSAVDVNTILGNTQELHPEDVAERVGLKADGTAILIGGPPCTAFSHAGFWLERKRNGTDPQADRIADYWRFVRALRPAAFVLENVPGLAFENHQSVLRHFVCCARRHKYRVAMRIVDAADFGVPQARRRLFVIGTQTRSKFVFPDGTFRSNPRGARWAFRDLRQATNPPEADEKLTGRYADFLRHIPPGDNYLFFTKRRGHPNPVFGWRKRYWSFLLKLHPERPSPTIAATRVSNNGPFHWKNRRLRLREMARLQGFPDSYPLGELHAARRQLGNAVPPLLASQIFWKLRRFLGDTIDASLPDTLALAIDSDASAFDVAKSLATQLAGEKTAQEASR